ncbi:tail fiber domain-containing protein [Burkholderia gladioli]|uniref:tail fiber domain-containing protein n=1 Tax=Burkholderia gladioli TaxID=28095 RepID=UPI00163E073C|nr:tail fiber domain-containing protein [Burkholderia gladioli]
MTTLQTINLGNPPDGAGGDTVRSGNAKVNANTAVLDACVSIGYQVLGASKTLALADVGTRIGLYFQQAGGTVVLPLANTVRQNGVIHFFNVGAQTVNIGLQGNDGSQISKIGAGDWVEYVSDANAYWHVVGRGRLTVDEVIGGALTTVGSITSGGLLTAPNVLTTTIDASGSGGQVRAVQGGYGAILRNDGFAVYLMSTDKNNAMGGFSALRPFWWNLVTGQVTIAGDGSNTTVGGSLAVSGQILAPEGTAQAPGISFQNDGSPDTGFFHLGDGVFGISCNASEVVRYSPSGARFSATPSVSGNAMWHAGNFNPASYAPLNAPSFSGKISCGPAGLFGGATLAVSTPASDPWSPPLGLRNTGLAAGKYWSIGPDGTNSFVLYNQGNVGVFLADGGTSWSSNSDETLKNIRAEISDAVASVKSIRTVRYTWKAEDEKNVAETGNADTSRLNVGVIAQDVQKVLAEAVSIGSEGKLAVAYGDLVPLALAAIKELAARVEALEAAYANKR